MIKQMKHVIIITNKPKDPELSVTKEIRSYLEEAGVTCSVYADEISTQQWQEILRTEGKCTDAILVLGGDGTMLRAAKDTAQANIPMLGINLGTLGYLAEVEKANIKPALEQLLAGDYTIEERMMLQGQVFRQDDTIEDSCALNDVAIVRNGPLQMLYFQIFVNGKFLKEYYADGIIVASPTGSTGYNMSAGGPIVEPGAQILLITPICPHTLQNRSVVLKAEDEVIIRVRKRDGYEQANMEVSFDGGRSVQLLPGDQVRITKSQRITSIIKLSEVSFLDVLHRKLRD